MPVSEYRDAMQNPEVQELTLKMLDLVEGKKLCVIEAASFHLEEAIKKQRHDVQNNIIMDGAALRAEVDRLKEFWT